MPATVEIDAPLPNDTVGAEFEVSGTYSREDGTDAFVRVTILASGGGPLADFAANPQTTPAGTGGDQPFALTFNYTGEGNYDDCQIYAEIAVDDVTEDDDLVGPVDIVVTP